MFDDKVALFEELLDESLSTNHVEIAPSVAKKRVDSSRIAFRAIRAECVAHSSKRVLSKIVNGQLRAGTQELSVEAESVDAS